MTRLRFGLAGEQCDRNAQLGLLPPTEPENEKVLEREAGTTPLFELVILPFIIEKQSKLDKVYYKLDVTS